MKPTEVFEKVKHIGVWFDLEDIEAMEKLKLPRKARILEIGTGSGRSALSLHYLYPDAEIHTCDREGHSEDLFEGKNIHFYNMFGAELASTWNKKIDLLFLDDDHMLDTVKLHFGLFEGFVKKGGYVVFHDYFKTDVEDAVKDLGLKVKAFKTGDYSQALWRKK